MRCVVSVDVRLFTSLHRHMARSRTFSITHSEPLHTRPSQKKFLPLCQPRTDVCLKTSTFLFHNEAVGWPGISGAEVVSGLILKKAKNIASGIPTGRLGQNRARCEGRSGAQGVAYQRVRRSGLYQRSSCSHPQEGMGACPLQRVRSHGGSRRGRRRSWWGRRA